MATRIEMHSPPRENRMKDRFSSQQVMTIVIVTLICITVAAVVLGGIYVGRH